MKDFIKPTEEEVAAMSDQQLSYLLEKMGCEVIDGVDNFDLINHGAGGGVTRLESENITDALFEAWSMVKPL